MVTYNDFILNFLGHLHDALQKQCPVETIVIINGPTLRITLIFFQSNASNNSFL